MKFFKTRNRYEASNLTLEKDTLLGHSYRWYEISKKIGPYVVVNCYNYSQSTIKQYYKIKRQIESMGYKIDFFIDAPKGLQDLKLAKEYYQSKINNNNEYMKRPRVRQETKSRLIEDNAKYAMQLTNIDVLMIHEGQND